MTCIYKWKDDYIILNAKIVDIIHAPKYASHMTKRTYYGMWHTFLKDC